MVNTLPEKSIRTQSEAHTKKAVTIILVFCINCQNSDYWQRWRTNNFQLLAIFSSFLKIWMKFWGKMEKSLIFKNFLKWSSCDVVIIFAYYTNLFFKQELRATVKVSLENKEINFFSCCFILFTYSKTIYKIFNLKLFKLGLLKFYLYSSRNKAVFT